MLLYAKYIETYHCGKVYSNTKGDIIQVIMQIPSNSTVKKHLVDTHCKLHIQSPYLPSSPGYDPTDYTHWELIKLKFYRRAYRPSRFVKTIFTNISLAFYIYLRVKANQLLNIKTKGNLSLYTNDKLITRLSGTYKWGCIHRKYKIFCDKHGFHVSYKKHKIILPLGMAWNKILIMHIPYEISTLFYLKGNDQSKIAAYIPYNTELLSSCLQTEDKAKSMLAHITSIKVDMRFTYGQQIGLNKLIKCLFSIIPDNLEKIKITGVLSSNYHYANITFSGNNNTKHALIELILNRDISRKCFGYTCIWYQIHNSTLKINSSKVTLKPKVFKWKTNLNHSRCYIYNVSTKQFKNIKNITLKLHQLPRSTRDINKLKNCLITLFPMFDNAGEITVNINNPIGIINVKRENLVKLLLNKTAPCYSKILTYCSKDSKPFTLTIAIIVCIDILLILVIIIYEWYNLNRIEHKNSSMSSLKSETYSKLNFSDK